MSKAEVEESIREGLQPLNSDSSEVKQGETEMNWVYKWVFLLPQEIIKKLPPSYNAEIRLYFTS